MAPTPYDMLRYDLRGFGQSVSLSAAPYNHADDLGYRKNKRAVAPKPAQCRPAGGPDHRPHFINLSPEQSGIKANQHCKHLTNPFY